MISRHPLGPHDIILPVGILAAVTGHFYTAMGMALLWGWLNKRQALTYKARQEHTSGAVSADGESPDLASEASRSGHD